MRITLLIVLVVAFIVPLSGCSPHSSPLFAVPVQAPDQYGQTKSATEQGVTMERWWEVFNDSRLNALIDEAFANNPNLAQMLARLEQADALVKITDASRQPQVSLGGSAGREKAPGALGTTTATAYRLSVSAGYEVDLWQRLKSKSSAAELNRAATREEIAALYLGLAAQVTDLYYLAIEQRQQLALTERTTAAFEKSLDLIEYRYREGLVPALDVYQARQILATSRTSKPIYEAGIARTEHALTTLLGRYPATLHAGEVVTLPETPAMFAQGLPSELLAQRPDVRAALLRVKAADAEVAAALADRFPKFNLLADYGSLRTLLSTGDVTHTLWSVAAGLTQPLWDGGRLAALVKSNRAGFQAQLEGYRQTALTAFREVEDALVANRSGEARIELLGTQAAAATATLRLARERYLQGLSDYLPVLTAQSSAFAAESQLLASRRQLVSERISLGRALGGQWMDDALQRRIVADGEAHE